MSDDFTEMVSEKQLAVQTIDGSAFKRVLSVQLSPQQELKKTTQGKPQCQPVAARHYA